MTDTLSFSIRMNILKEQIVKNYKTNNIPLCYFLKRETSIDINHSTKIYV